MAFTTRLARNGLELLYRSGLYRAFEPVSGGVGIIFRLHRVRPQMFNPRRDFAPNAALEITPQFLADAILRTRENGFEAISLDEARLRLLAGNDRRFAVFTLDHGYRDTLDHAAPVFAEYDCPFTVFVTTGFADRNAVMWWIALERAIDGKDSLKLEISGTTIAGACRTPGEKAAAFDALYGFLLEADETERLAVVRRLCNEAGYDLADICETEAMGWDELARLAGNPLATIGAHGLNHPILSRLGDAAMRRELIDSRVRLTAMLGKVPRYLAYPHGDEGSAGGREFAAARELGYAAAVTGRSGMVSPKHANYLTALPRIPLSGAYKSKRNLDVLLGGAPTALMNRFRSADAA